ncbi:paraquat-inducible protein A [bacterium]|nr:paraquat-inducible protein A [bacterium]
MKFIRVVLLFSIFCFSIFFAIKIYSTNGKTRELKADYIELSMVKYGLFNVDEWKKVASTIISKKINELNLKGADKEAMKSTISSFLYQEIDAFEKRFHQQQQKSILGIVKSIGAEYLGAFEDIKKEIPNFTESILNFVDSKQSKEAIKEYVNDKLNEYSKETFSELDYSLFNSILEKHKSTTKEEALLRIETSINENQDSSTSFKWGMISIFILSSILLFALKSPTKEEFLSYFFISFTFLAMGALMPMIELDARISEMSFTLLHEEIKFTDQVLFYKSKSILEVVQLMMQNEKIEMILVGFLVILFSVLFPISKLIASVTYLYLPAFKNNKFLKFMAFKTGKWSMADVMVIAIFMSYLGFDGILSEQLHQIEGLTDNVNILATNQSSLMFGFYSFLMFVIFSLLITQKLQNYITKKA